MICDLKDFGPSPVLCLKERPKIGWDNLTMNQSRLLFSRIKLQTPVWRWSGSLKGPSAIHACSPRMPPAPAGGGSLTGQITYHQNLLKKTWQSQWIMWNYRKRWKQTWKHTLSLSIFLAFSFLAGGPAVVSVCLQINQVKKRQARA